MTSYPDAASGTARRPLPDGELEDRAAGPRGQGEEQVEVARVLGQVEVVEARERLGRRLAAHAVPGPE